MNDQPALTALALNCTLKPSPAESNTEALARAGMDALSEHGVKPEMVRVVDHDVRPGVTDDEGDGDEWPSIRERVLSADILVIATPTRPTVPGQAWTYWNRGPGPGPTYLEEEAGATGPTRRAERPPPTWWPWPGPCAQAPFRHHPAEPSGKAPSYADRRFGVGAFRSRPTG